MWTLNRSHYLILINQKYDPKNENVECLQVEYAKLKLMVVVFLEGD